MAKQSLTGWIRNYFVENPRATVQQAMRVAALEFPGRKLSRHTFQTVKTEAKRLGKIDQKSLEVLVNAVVDDRLVGSRARAEELVKTLFGDQKDDFLKIALKAVEDKTAELIEKHRPIEVIVTTTDDKGKVKKRVKKMKYSLPPEFDIILAYASIRKNIMLVGPTGSGKSFICERVAEALGLSFSSVSCSVGLSESQLSGWLLPIHAGGKFGYLPAPFIKAYTEGGVFLIDEIDNGDANVLTFMNAALANGHMYIPQRGIEGEGMERVERHPDFICIAAANTFGTGPDAMYVGRNRLDEATLNRFVGQRVYMDYNPDVELSIAGKSKKAYVWCTAVRKAIRDRRLRRIMSTRNIKDFAEQEASGNPILTDVKRWEDSLFADWKDDERRAVQAAGRSALRTELGIEVE